MTLAAATILLAIPALAQPRINDALVEGLRGGGYNIYMRHAATEWSQNDRIGEAGGWTSCDPAKMRQLSPEGRAAARRIGEAMRALGVPVGEVLSSEYCRAAQTARLLGFGEVATTRDIMNMRAAHHVGGREAVIRRAREVLATPPPEGSNRVIVGHGNLMRAATGAYAGEGGAGIYRPDPAAGSGFELVGEISAEDWLTLARRMGKGR